MMNSKVLDESIAESLQTLDLMCFSEQYYFLVALISFGMLLVTIRVEIKLLRRLLDGVEAHKSTWRAGETSTRSERPLQQKRNHSHGSEMDTSRMEGTAPRRNTGKAHELDRLVVDHVLLVLGEVEDIF